MDEVEGLEIFRWQQRIGDTLSIYRQKYHYAGPPGGEYGVVFGLFRELNRLESPGNRHIFWYAAMPVLIESYRHFLTQGQLPNFYPLKWGDQQRTGAKMEKNLVSPTKEPPYLWSLENYIKGIVTLGIIRATKLPAPEEYTHFTLNRILSQIKILVQKMAPHPNMTAAEIPLVLTVKEATDNLGNLVLEKEHALYRELARVKISSPYKRNIHRKFHQLTQAEIHSYSDMDNFWNGFIP